MADTYRITDQHETPDLDASGRRFVKVWEVSYEVTSGPAKGTVGMVTVQPADHTKAYVDQAIRAKISTLHGIAGLGEEPVKE